MSRFLLKQGGTQGEVIVEETGGNRTKTTKLGLGQCIDVEHKQKPKRGKGKMTQVVPVITNTSKETDAILIYTLYYDKNFQA